MPPDTSNSLVNLSGWSKPADTFVKKMSNAVGGLFAPYQIKRISKAEAEAALIKAQSDIEITDLHRRAARRWIEQEARHQENMENITAKAVPKLNEDAKSESMDDDWIVNFLDKGRIVSDSEMQELWSRILAGEANKPGTYSRRTVNSLSDLDKTDADLFTRFCGFVWEFKGLTPVVLDTKADIYNKYDINFDTLIHLDSIGFVRFDRTANFFRIRLPLKFSIYYYDKPLFLEMPQGADNKLAIGNVLLTRIGKDLASICKRKPVEGFYEYVKDKWKQYLPESERERQISV